MLGATTSRLGGGNHLAPALAGVGRMHPLTVRKASLMTGQFHKSC